jgi:hypothetical protein
MDWRPDAATSARDRQDLGAKLARAIELLITLAGFPASDSLARLRGATVRGAPALVHPETFRWYNLMLAAVNEADPGQQRRLYDLLPQVEQDVTASRARAVANLARVGAEVDLGGADEAVATSFQRCKETTALVPQDITLYRVPTDEVAVANLRAGYDLVARLWPEEYQDIQDCIQKIVLFDEQRSGGLMGFTDFRYHGAIFVRSKVIRDAQSAVEVADQLVHEAAHARLNTYLATYTLILNAPDELYSSPLRNDPRPLLGVFQQMYVLSRLTQLYSRVCAEQPQWASTLAETRADLEQALAIVQTHATLSEEGSELVESIAAYSRQAA